MSKESWKDVPGFEGRYQVSSMGRVKSLMFRGHECLGEHIMAQVYSNGYRVLRLCGKTHSVHSLVALAFLGERPTGHDVNHKNGKRDDNRLQNLEYCTRQENILHSRDVLGKTLGMPAHRGYGTPEFVHPSLGKPNHGKQKFSWECAQLIIKLHEDHGMPKKGLARHFHCTVRTIRGILSYKTLAYMDLPSGGRTGNEPTPDYVLAWDLPE